MKTLFSGVKHLPDQKAEALTLQTLFNRHKSCIQVNDWRPCPKRVTIILLHCRAELELISIAKTNSNSSSPLSIYQLIEHSSTPQSQKICVFQNNLKKNLKALITAYMCITVHDIASVINKC